MGGCCCHNDDTKEDDGEEKCIIVKNEEPKSPRKEYGSVSTVEDQHDLDYTIPQEPDRLLGQVRNKIAVVAESDDVKVSSEAEPHPPAIDASQIGVSLQETPASNLGDSREAVSIHEDGDEPPTDEMSQGEVDREIDELVAAAMATKVIYPPNVTDEETSLYQSSDPVPHRPPSPQTTQEPTSDQDADSDQEAQSSKPISLMKKTQMSIRKVKARASSMVLLSSRQKSGEQIEKKRGSFQEKKTKRSGLSESTSEKDSKKTLHAKKDNREKAQVASKKSEFQKKKGFHPGERMKSHYAKDRVALFEVERDTRDKMASQRSSTDPRKAALERGERLGQLDDTIDDMRDHSSSFAQVARQLKDEQRGRTSTFPW